MTIDAQIVLKIVLLTRLIYLHDTEPTYGGIKKSIRGGGGFLLLLLLPLPSSAITCVMCEYVRRRGERVPFLSFSRGIPEGEEEV